MFKKKIFLFAVIVIVAVIVKAFIHKNEMQSSAVATASVTEMPVSADQDIQKLTEENTVAEYVKQHHHLPDYYITKNEARKHGWIAAQGNLCDVFPGHAIGGDRFGNREHRLPDAQGRKWFEADVNFDCGRRNADRLLYSDDGLVFVTKDHYQTFEKK